MVITTQLPEDILSSLPVEKNFFIGYIIQDDDESPVFSDVDEAKRYAHNNNILKKLGYSIVSKIKAATKTTDYSDEELYCRGDILSIEEYLYYDKQLNVWKK